MNKQDLTYWFALTMMQTLKLRRKNEIYVSCFKHEPRFSIVDLFESKDVRAALNLSENEEHSFDEARSHLANHSFAVDDLLSQGYEIIPLHSDKYPRILKKNLGLSSPTVLFAKGNTAMLQENAVAVVGSRNASPISLQFADNIAQKAAANQQVVVSGFAKGIDREALNAAVTAGGKSIIVLPQGILKFSSGFKEYYRYIVQGKVLVISTFAPQASWSVKLAMARNSTIYGLAHDIYVAQSDSKGGTWSGAVEGLRKGRRIYVRCPEIGEANANNLLISKGGVPVDMYGEKVDVSKLHVPFNEDLFAGQDLFGGV